MKAGTLVRIADDILGAVSSDLIDPADEFKTLTPAQIGALAVKIEAALVTHGVVIPQNVDRVIQALPLILSFFGGAPVAAPGGRLSLLGDRGAVSPFSGEAIKMAISSALALSPLPPGKTFVLVGMATTDGVRGVIAAKLGEHWTAMGEVDLHGGHLTAGVSVIASW